nr:MAG TPA: hypothetical protein [Caudoviricetes sp.]
MSTKPCRKPEPAGLSRGLGGMCLPRSICSLPFIPQVRCS